MCVCANIIGTGNHGTYILLNIYRGKYFAVIATLNKMLFIVVLEWPSSIVNTVN